MDQTCVDVTDLPGVKVGDVAMIVGRDGGREITAIQAALGMGTIPNELLCRLGNRLPRVYSL
jgi:serine/alanine racemase